jgi:hypothetical protein
MDLQGSHPAARKYSAAEMKRYLTEHFGVESAKHVPADQWPRLYEALKNATA